MTTPNRSSDRLPRPGDTLREIRIPAPESTLFPSSASRTRYFDAKLRLLPGVMLPLRSMLVAGRDQQILISPVATAEEAALAGVMPLTVVAPSLLHHRHLEAALERYHPVALWGPPGLADKKPELVPIHVFGLDAWPHRELLDFAIIEGAPRRNEVVFFHRDSRTIYAADLFFHIRKPEGALTPITFRLMGIHGRFAVAKMWRHWVTDRAAFQRSIDRVLAWDFDRIVVAHGEIVDRDARSRFEAALRECGLR